MKLCFAQFLMTVGFLLPSLGLAQESSKASALPLRPASPPPASASSKMPALKTSAGRVQGRPERETRTIRIRATAYSWRERAHRYTYGRHNCMGGLLTELVEGCQQCAADTDIFPLGTILEIPGAGRRIVTDRGSAVEGGHHIDVHFNTLQEMMDWGTQIVQARVIRRGWGK